MNKAAPLASVAAVCAVLGLVDSWYLARSAYEGLSLTCNISGLDGCNTVAQSAYSHLFGIPLGAYGVVFYALVLSAAIIVRSTSSVPSARALLALSIVGVVASAIFVGIQVFLIQALCIYCLGSAALSLALLFAALAIFRKVSAPAAPVLS
jgi:uncharacterized membrane protein